MLTKQSLKKYSLSRMNDGSDICFEIAYHTHTFLEDEGATMSPYNEGRRISTSINQSWIEIHIFDEEKLCQLCYCSTRAYKPSTARSLPELRQKDSYLAALSSSRKANAPPLERILSTRRTASVPRRKMYTG